MSRAIYTHGTFICSLRQEERTKRYSRKTYNGPLLSAGGIIKFLRGYFGKICELENSHHIAARRPRQQLSKAGFFSLSSLSHPFSQRYEANKMDSDEGKGRIAVLFPAVSRHFRPARRLGAFKAHFIFKGNMPMEYDLNAYIIIYTLNFVRCSSSRR